MLDSKGFDNWANEYDHSVSSSDEENSYPFAGYQEILNTIASIVTEKSRPKVLDLGFGTGTLTAMLHEQGCDIYGIDFSEKMIEAAKARMPDAHLIKADFSKGLPSELNEEKFDFIIGTYSLHHLYDDEKPVFLKQLLTHLKEGGKILIGDVAFETRALLEECAAKEGEAWDAEEYYFVIDELRSDFRNLTFEQISYCAGIITISA